MSNMVGPLGLAITPRCNASAWLTSCMAGKQSIERFKPKLWMSLISKLLSLLRFQGLDSRLDVLVWCPVKW